LPVAPIWRCIPITQLNGIGRAYLDPETKLFVGIDENNIIRKTYPASENLIDFLQANCYSENYENE
jgi:hypothetical protein